MLFRAMHSGTTAALRGLTEPVVDETDRPRTMRLATIAASAAIGGVAGAVGAIVGDYVQDLVSGTLAGAVTGSAKDVVKQALRTGSGAQVSTSHQSPLACFEDLQYSKSLEAEGAFYVLFRGQLVPLLWQLSEQRLLDIRTLVGTVARDGAYAAQKRSTQVEWVNFVARLSHGGEACEDETAGSNVDPATVREQGLLGISQRQFLPGRRGILEIGLSMECSETDDDLRVVGWE